ncbi:MAG TPA: hypothetical protein DIU35_00275 [Candidatus Latescibacteria bacterium]|nr:hypothetical protein [Candidatus Latescibacterota bacterium]
MNIVTFDSRDNSIYAVYLLDILDQRSIARKTVVCPGRRLPVLLTHPNRTIWRRNRTLWAKRLRHVNSIKYKVYILDLHLNLVRYGAEQFRGDCSGQQTPVNPGTF